MSIVEASHLGKRFRRTWALRDCSVAVPAGQVIALVGPNGAGKTTLLRILAGLIPPTQGRASVLDGAVPGTPTARDGVSYVDQNLGLYRSLRVRDVLAAAAALNNQWDRQLALTRLADVGIPLGKRAGHLSGGQQAQLALALALARRPRLLLLDEPLASLDPLARQEVMGLLMTAVAEEGLSVVFSSHAVAELERVAGYLIVLSAGQVQVSAPVDSLLEGHLNLTGPAGEADRLGVPVITVTKAGRQAHVLARTSQAPPGWVARPVTMEEVVLGYLKQPAARLLPSLAAAR
jgi:ABC-2 type transport system ATP-binding protein